MSLIVFSQVSKIFQPAGDGLVEVSFVVEPAELVLITGPSGAGKTTLLRLLTKEYDPTDGEILFSDQPLHKIKNRHLHQHRRRIGVVFQDNKLIIDRNVWENVALPLYIVGEKKSIIEQRVADLLTLVGLADKALLFPSQLSGGEAQRVGIARALALAPELIFADEPTGNLDEATSLNIAHLLYKIHQLGTTVMLATHDPIIIKSNPNQRVLHLEKGQLVKDTRPVKVTVQTRPSDARTSKQGKIDQQKESTNSDDQTPGSTTTKVESLDVKEQSTDMDNGDKPIDQPTQTEEPVKTTKSAASEKPTKPSKKSSKS